MIWALLKFKSNIIAMSPAYITNLDFAIKTVDSDIKKIDDLFLKTQIIVIIRFLYQNKLKKLYLFKQSLLFIEINIKMVLQIFFFLK